MSSTTDFGNLAAEEFLFALGKVTSQMNVRSELAPSIVTVIAETYKLNEVNKAYDRVAEGKVRFRAVIVS